MGDTTTPVFIVGSGRSGTRALYKALLPFDGVEAHHEYCCTHIQPVAAKFFMGKIARDEVVSTVRCLHGAAVRLSASETWVDSSNKLTWIVDPLIEVFPTARFVNVVRDGRKVAVSYVRKLGDEMYDDASVNALTNWVDDPSQIEPPPEKKYWWNIPQAGQPFHTEFPGFNQIERAAYHWVEANRVARESLQAFVPPDQQLTVRLEDLVSSTETQNAFLEFLGLTWSEHFAQLLKKPQNVIVPIDYKMNASELQAFAAIASTEMTRLGYRLEDPEYSIVY